MDVWENGSWHCSITQVGTKEKKIRNKGELVESTALSVVDMACSDDCCRSWIPKRTNFDLAVVLSAKTAETKTFLRRRNKSKGKVPPRFELGWLDSESRVLTVTPWNHVPVVLLQHRDDHCADRHECKHKTFNRCYLHQERTRTKTQNCQN